MYVLSMFEWDRKKNQRNREKHGVSFQKAKKAFLDPRRILVKDLAHGSGERRWFYLCRVQGGVLTVRFTYRKERIRIFGAGYWRKGRRRYEEENKIQ